MTTWLLKTEPTTYSWSDLVKDKKTVWDGIASNAALLHLRAMKAGDEALIYHSNAEKAIMGIAKIIKSAYPDPKLDDPKRVVIEVAPVKALARPVTLAEIKAKKALEKMALVRISQLSCQPVTDTERKVLEKMGVK